MPRYFLLLFSVILFASGAPLLADKPYKITTKATSGGKITPRTANPKVGETKTLSIRPDNGYHVVSVTGCGGAYTPDDPANPFLGGTYTSAPATGDCEVSAVFHLGSNHPPTVNAGVDQTVDGGAAVTLGAVAADDDGFVAHVAWTQTVGPAVPFIGAADQELVSFTAPRLSADTTFTFEVTATDNEGATASDIVQILVKRAVSASGRISAGASHLLYVDVDGDAYAVGAMTNDQACNPTLDLALPRRVFSSVQTVAAGNCSSFFITSSGDLYSCGENGAGQLGLGDTISRQLPAYVMSDVDQVSSNGTSTFVIKKDGSLYSAGKNILGELGTGDLAPRYSFTKVLDSVVQVSPSPLYYSVALRDDGSVWASGWNQDSCWGSEAVASGSPQTTTTVYEKIFDGAKYISAGPQALLLVSRDGGLYVAGSNANNQLGTGDGLPRPSFTRIMEHVKKACAGGDYLVVLCEDGSVYTAGYNSLGQLGTGDYVSRMGLIKVYSGAIDICAGYCDTYVVRPDGIVLAAGNNCVGQLGEGALENSNVFVLTKITVKLQ